MKIYKDHLIDDAIIIIASFIMAKKPGPRIDSIHES